jgi:hypothetical protein
VSEPADEGKTPDGTSVIRHDTAETKLGVSPHAGRYRKARESAYAQLFGEALNVSHELLPLVPNIDVYIFQRKRGDQIVYSLVTGGMSDLEMTLPRSAVHGTPRGIYFDFALGSAFPSRQQIVAWSRPHDAERKPSRTFLGGALFWIRFSSFHPSSPRTRLCLSCCNSTVSRCTFSGWSRSQLQSAISSWKADSKPCWIFSNNGSIHMYSTQTAQATCRRGLKSGTGH